MKIAVVQNDVGYLVTLKKKFKVKKKRLKEAVGLWEESRRCSEGQTDEPEAVEPPSKRNATENGEMSKPSTGMGASHAVQAILIINIHTMHTAVRNL